MTAVRRLEQSSWYVPITTAQYHRMIDQGILEDGAPVELLDGLIVPKDRAAAGEDPMSHHPLHRAVVTLIHALTGRIDSDACFLQVQLPVDLSPESEPEPDGAVIVGRRLDYLRRLPTAADVLCVIEAAHSSLKRDAEVKAPIYAGAGIPQYVLINLPGGVIEVLESPVGTVYGVRRIVSRGESFLLATAAGGVTVAASELLP